MAPSLQEDIARLLVIAAEGEEEQARLTPAQQEEEPSPSLPHPSAALSHQEAPSHEPCLASSRSPRSHEEIPAISLALRRVSQRHVMIGAAGAVALLLIALLSLLGGWGAPSPPPLPPMIITAEPIKPSSAMATGKGRGGGGGGGGVGGREHAAVHTMEHAEGAARAKQRGHAHEPSVASGGGGAGKARRLETRAVGREESRAPTSWTSTI